MAQSVCEIVRVYQLLSEIGLETTLPTEICCDNQTTLHLIFHERTKHIEVDYHFIREKIQKTSFL